MVRKESKVYQEMKEYLVLKDLEVNWVVKVAKVRQVNQVIVVLRVFLVMLVLLLVPQDSMLLDTVKVRIHHHVHLVTRKCGMVTVCYMYKVWYFYRYFNSKMKLYHTIAKNSAYMEE